MVGKPNSVPGLAVFLLWTALPTVAAGEIPAGMALIPAGAFTMGDAFNDANASELPLHKVYVSAFYMDRYDVTKLMWDGVYQWAVQHGYSFDNAGLGKAADHPVHSVNWYDAVKWCNARSEKEGLAVCYYTTVSRAVVYRAGQIDLTNSCVNWAANGYRLPTSAEWEKASRGGAEGHRFPWSDADTISHIRANYYSSSRYPYDVSPTRGYHPKFNDGVPPYTNPVGYFPPNGYGLYDMAGNIWQWCWDRVSSGWYKQPGASANDTRGPDSGSSSRVMRGGSFHRFAFNARSSNLSLAGDVPDFAFLVFGFRCARGIQ
jgi:formylglycine-generating enzyme required for sulfatase activity